MSYCLDFCEKNRIDIFAPRRKLVAISRHKDQFERIGVKVLVDDYEAVNMLNRKDLAYKFFNENGIGIVPEYCFHRIVERENAFSALRWKQGSRITIRKAYSALSEVEKFDPVIVMPYLPGEEISVDCLKTKDGIIAVPRYKGSSRAERIKYDPDIIRYCSDFYSKVDLEMPCNIQFKFSGEIPYILEVNTRMSGGVQMSYVGSGINIPNIAINKVLGRPKEWHCDKRECIVSYVENPVLM